MRHILILISLSLMAASIGCRRSTDATAGAIYDNLPGLRHSHHGALADELARITDERSTPSLLQEFQADIQDPSENAATELLAVLTPLELKQLRSQIDVIMPIARQQQPGMKREYQQVASHHLSALRATHQALQKPSCRFPIQHNRGMLADEQWIDYLETLVRLELVSTIAHWDAREIDEALERMIDAFRISAFLSAEFHLPARVRAAQFRIETVGLAMELAHDSQIEEQHIDQLVKVIDQTIEEWPHDSLAWIGERVRGIHTYELVRDGHLPSLLTERDSIQFRDGDQILTSLDDAIRNVDDDEHYYLATMRRIIESCDRSSEVRQSVFQEIHQELDKLIAGKSKRIASLILLTDIEAGHYWPTRDRAACESLAQGLRPLLNNRR